MRDAFQLQGSAAKIYEEQKVPAIFGPLAEATLSRFPIAHNDRVLDLACGTGILARTIRTKIGASVHLTGSDLNAGMIETARELTNGLAPPIRWEVANAAETPFADGEFTVVMCQQGIQFFSDKRAAAMEMRRVLSAGGRLCITVWAGISPFFRSMADALECHVSPDAAKVSVAPFTYEGADRLPGVLKAAGFASIAVQSLTINRVMSNPALAIPKEIMGNPVGPAVAEKGDAVMIAIVNEMLKGCAPFMQGADLVVPQEAHLITARVE